MAIETERLCWLHVPAEDEVSDEVAELWAKPLEKLGFVPNVLRVYAIRPRHLQLWNAFYDELMRGDSGLTKAQRVDVGWTDEDVMDIAEVTAMFNFTNRLASGLGWRPNDEYVSLGR